MINKLLNYSGIAIHACSGKSVVGMKRDIDAALYHYCDFLVVEKSDLMFYPNNP